jgi:hypothetical protein
MSIHAEDRCPCHGKTEAELSAPYTASVFGLIVMFLVTVVIRVVA